MNNPINLADPDFEPTDEQLAEPARRAFSGVREAREAAMTKARAQMVLQSAATLKDYEERIAKGTSGA